ncbi:type II toxin-antitoxin system RelE/ParE family toxin [Sphingobium sp.]|uniref:type II toxin-antitoxin system RelE/ParE family toxin n=1 Tax=Sphingobium sp. TaxID=1912891 RepID=UPI00257F7ADE|nr:type II toxin-antitoxin system RelE/ParE family toxin [Sphingobium sp.]
MPLYSIHGINPRISWDVESTDQFGDWYVDLSEAGQAAIQATVNRLIALGPNLRFPHSSGINNSRHSHMRELRIQSGGRPLRIFYAFDPRRSAILLIGGDKTGDDRFYERMIPVADELYDVYLQELRQEGLIK